jgi:hypothetical protein
MCSAQREEAKDIQLQNTRQNQRFLMSRYPLYGGAISAVLPSHLVDVSQIRQVPDTQEVFILEEGLDDAKLDQSFIFDLLEHVDAGLVEESLRIHIQELGDVAALYPSFKVIRNEALQMDTYFSFFIQPSPKSDKLSLVTMISLIPLTRTNTDVVITLNVPILQLEEKTLTIDELACEIFTTTASSINRAFHMIAEATRTLHIEDWSLFAL